MSTSTASTAAQRPVTAYLPQGRFGHAVVERLAGPQDAVVPVDHGLVYAALPYADRLVMVADADRTALREALDEVSFTRSLPSLGLELTPTELRCALGALDGGAASAAGDDEGEIGGQVWTVDLVSGTTSLARTVATDRCQTCSGRYATRRDGVPALAALLPERVI